MRLVISAVIALVGVYTAGAFIFFDVWWLSTLSDAERFAVLYFYIFITVLVRVAPIK